MKNSTIRFTLITLVVITGLYVVIDHGQHLIPYLPFVFLLGCLVMHLFMQGSHRNHNKTDQHNQGHENDE